MRRALFAFLLAAAACSESNVGSTGDSGAAANDAGVVVPPNDAGATDSGLSDDDLDDDGFSAAQGDCDDNDRTRHPDAEEICDGVDNNCNIQVDEGVTTTYYMDNDGDQHGNTDPAMSVQACQQPDGFVADNSDCDDTRVTVHGGADEICDGLDNDCDSDVDETQGDFNCEGCMDRQARNYDQDATRACADCCEYAREGCDGESGRQVELCIRNRNPQAGTLDVYMLNNVAVGGWQFGLSNATIVDASGGLAGTHNMMVQHNGDTLLGFSLNGSKVNPGQGILLNMTYTPSGNNDDICIIDAVVASQLGAGLTVDVHCSE